MESRSYPIKQVKYSRRVNVQEREAANVVLPLDMWGTVVPGSSTATLAVSPRLHFASSCLLNLLHNLTPSPLYNLSKYKHVYVIDLSRYDWKKA